MVCETDQNAAVSNLMQKCNLQRLGVPDSPALKGNYVLCPRSQMMKCTH